MIFLALFATIISATWCAFVLLGNSMRSSPGDFVGGPSIVAACGVTAILWLAWIFN